MPAIPLFMCIDGLLPCMCVRYIVQCARRPADPLGLQLQIVVSHCKDVLDHLEGQAVFLTTEPSL